ncbi:pimeloyl-ACP methyl ester carboxylesterase [Litoreibacter halocynthiae]|uniref:Pimeloyl-ACP methyl ester carboxylesterase n=1 Tax=Litoreibacter halocynthiae TaxID=1242689 RepID=A0A4R7LJD4_9RHOB|nr:alpha/beta hydrolase [Litoreibacter halocynthiae]TDT74170.1 pimeloyl-ACP methyl ester carboxylesterase [Litoreibacter halocynthiae]
MSKFTTADGLSLHYTDEGEGLPVLCLSGLTRNSSDFDYVAPHLNDVRLIRMDYRGRGQSDWADPSTYTLPQEGQDALALLDHLGIEKAAILGTSRGGIIAMGLAATVKDRLLGVCLNDIGPDIAEPGLDAIKNYLGRRPTFKTYDEATAQRAKLMAGFEDVPESRWREEAEKHYVKKPDGLDINYDPKLREAVLSGPQNLNPDLWPFFDALKGLPLALLRGANSDLLTRETTAEMERRRPDMLSVDVQGRGHVPFLDEPESLLTIKAWLEEMR